MNTHMAHLISEWAGLKIAVLGDAILDIYLQGWGERNYQEEVVLTVTRYDRIDNPGGAANTAANVASLGGQVRLVSVMGDDEDGDCLCEALQDRGVSTEYLLRSGSRHTLTKSRVMAGSQIMARSDAGTQALLGRRTEQRLLNQLSDAVSDCDAIIVSDYGYGVLTPRVITTLGAWQRRTPRILVVDSRYQLSAFKEIGVTAVKPNYNEAVQLLGTAEIAIASARPDAIAACGSRLLDLTGAQLAAVTLDSEGAILFGRDRPPYRTYANPRRYLSAIGAGDTFLSALTLALATEAPADVAVEAASAAAAVVVEKEGTAVCSAKELSDSFFFNAKDAFADRRNDILSGHNEQILAAW